MYDDDARYKARMVASPSATAPLADRRIVVPESRELDLFARMLEAQGAATIRCPMVTITDADEPAPVEAWLRRLAGRGFDDLILLTGEGLRRLMAAARRSKLETEVRAALAKLRTITRGPKPVRALRDLGLAPGLIADTPTTQGVIDTLAREKLTGRRVGVQLYPDNPNALLLDFLRGAGAIADPIVPYRYASDAETERVAAIIREMAEGRIDVIAFTSSPQVTRLQQVARDRGLEPQLREALMRTRLAAVGPVVAAAIEAIGGKVAIMPPNAFHMKPLVNTIREALADPLG